MGHRTATRRASLLAQAHSMIGHQLAIERRSNDALRRMLDGARYGRSPPRIPVRARLEVIGHRLAIAALRLRRGLQKYGSHALVAALSAALGVAVAIGALRASTAPPPPPPPPTIVTVPVPQPPIETVRYLDPGPPVEIIRRVVATPPRGLAALIREVRFARCGARGRVTGRVWLDEWGRIQDVAFQRGVLRGSRIERCLQRHVDQLIRYDLPSGGRASDAWVTFETPYGEGEAFP
jgi:hypothetical protein